MDDEELEKATNSLKAHLSTTTEGQKGDAGTILVIGGSKYYTGAPFFVAMAALETGSELVYLFSEPEGIIPLKTLLPESIVCEIEYQEWILCRVTVCVVGSGLGRPSKATCTKIKKILAYLDEKQVPVIFDGDGIRLSRELGVNSLDNVILTPNLNEKKHIEKIEDRFFYVFKGANDLIIGCGKTLLIDVEGCEKRVGGQGDILAGVIASLVSKCKFPLAREDILASLILGCRLVRTAGSSAYKKHWKSLITRDILEELKESFKTETIQ